MHARVHARTCHRVRFDVCVRKLSPVGMSFAARTPAPLAASIMMHSTAAMVPAAALSVTQPASNTTAAWHFETEEEAGQEQNRTQHTEGVLMPSPDFFEDAGVPAVGGGVHPRNAE